jgi:phosphate-selective porin OprO and OprP
MSHRWLIPAAVAALSLAPGAHAADAEAALRAEVDALRAQLQLLESRLDSLGAAPAPVADDASLTAQDQRLRILERKVEIQQEDAIAKAPVTPVIAIGDKGLSVKNPKGDFEIKLRGTVQADYRGFVGDDDVPFNDTFLFRRIRPSIEGQLGSLIAFRLTPELAGDSATVVDAYVDVRFDPRYTLRVGKVKGPIGLERLQSASALALIERGFPTELAPNRDLGIQLQGDLAAARVNYAIGVFNGTPDGRDATTTDSDNNLEYAGRLFFEPWKNDANALSGLGFGIAASAGEKDGAGNNFLPRYRTPGQNIFFNYRTAVTAHGSHTRFSPQAYYYRNAFGLQAEYIESEQELLLPGVANSRTELSHDAWQVTGSWVLTGEDGGYRGVTRPSRPFQIGGDGWGAFELVARYGELDVDDAAFPRYADPSVSATGSDAFGLGLNWFLTSNLKLAFNHTRASFDGGAPGGADREDEKTFFSRVQVAF